MKFTWHIIKKDILRECWALLTWALLFAGQIGIGVFARNATGTDQDTVGYLQLASGGLVFLQVVMGYILVARLVHADALVGTSMSWRTRPISAGRLLAAKLLGALLLFALLPVLLLLPWWLYCQFGWREILWSGVDLVGWQLLMIAPAFLVASLTDDLGRVLMWTLLLVIGLLSWIVLLQSSLTSSLGSLSGRTGASVMFTRLWACGMILIGGSLAIAAHQFLTRRFVRSVVFVIFGLGLIALTGRVWPWDWSRTFASPHRPALPPADPGLLEHLSIAVEPARGYFGGGFKAQNVDERDAHLDLALRVSGLPADLNIAAEACSQTWSWGEGLKLTRSSNFYWWGDSSDVAVLRRTYSLPVPVDDPETIRWIKVRRERIMDRVNASRAARGLPPIPVFIPPPQGAVALLHGQATLPNSYLAKMKAEPPAYRADAQWTLYRSEVVADLPLKDDARAAGQAQTLHLRRVKGATSWLISTRPAVSLTGVWFATAAVEEFRNRGRPERFATVNRVTGDITLMWHGQGDSKMLQVGGVIVTWNVLGVDPHLVIRDDKDVPADPQWRDHSILVLIADKDVAVFNHAVEAPRFELKPDAPTNSP